MFVLTSFRTLTEYYYINRITISVSAIASTYTNTINDAQKIMFNSCKNIFQRLTLGPEQNNNLEAAEIWEVIPSFCHNKARFDAEKSW